MHRMQHWDVISDFYQRFFNATKGSETWLELFKRVIMV